MSRNLSSWHGDWSGLRVAVLGLGKSGFSAVDTLVELGSDVRVFAKKISSEYQDILDVLKVPVTFSDEPQDFSNSGWIPELAIVSPGFSPSQPLVRELANLNVPLWTDIDLAWNVRDKVKQQRWVCITGTNGKTTTTELTAAMLRAAGLRAIACGNIGNPVLDAVRDPEGFDYLVVELSSFQLHYLQSISPYASAFLNLAEDHIDWHGSFELYGKAKAKVYENTQIACIYNPADIETEKFLEQAEVVEGCRAIGFTSEFPSVSMVGFVEGILVDRAFLQNRQNEALEVARPEDLVGLGILSKHLKQNIAAATALARACGVETDAIAQALREFKISPHRIELVAQIDGISFVNDSKATNAHAARASLSSFENIVWICGGLLKGVDPSLLVREFASKLRAAVLIGAETGEFQAVFQKYAPNVELIVTPNTADVMAVAVASAKELAKPGDTVLLAPAAASMDQFRDYADRGDKFKSAVLALGGVK